MSSVGIVANPASGKDIRRLVAHGSTFDNNEKINVVRRVLLGLDAVGVERVLFMPDAHAIVPRAAATISLNLELNALPMTVFGNSGDSYEAARRFADLGLDCIVTLGGDGTNRAVVKGCGDIPLMPLSTGTNNVFPNMVEGTLAGLAAGVVAKRSGNTGGERIIRRFSRLDVLIDGEERDIALIDVVTSHHAYIGARALWDPARLSEIVPSRIVASAIGMCSLGGLLFPGACDGCHGAHIVVGESSRTIKAAIAPGLIRDVPIADAKLIDAGDEVHLKTGVCTIALDGEREIEILRPGQQVTVRLNPRGPRVIDMDAAIRRGAERGEFRTADG